NVSVMINEWIVKKNVIDVGVYNEREVGEDANEVHAEDVNTAGIVAEGAASDDVNAAGGIIANIDADDDTVTVASTTIADVDVPIPTATIVVAPTLTAAPSRRRKGVVIRDPQ
nr:hypothetical protein [Tanacetum cinerariifolium]